MQKKNIIMILAGIIILLLEFTIKIGDARIDIFSDILAYVLILIGILPLTNRNNLFKKSRNNAIYGLIITTVVQAMNFVDWGDGASSIDNFTKGLVTIFAIYFTYYFTESIMLEAKMQDKSALTRNFRISWSLLGILIFVNYIAFISTISIAAIIVQALVIVSALYFSTVVITACDQLYTDEMPKHSEV